MSNIAAPTLDTDLRQGHSWRCRDLVVTDYPDLHQDIMATYARVNEVLAGFLSDVGNIDSVGKIDRQLRYFFLGLSDFGDYLSVVFDVQDVIKSGSLSETNKATVWGLIADCYQRIQTALSERCPG